MEIIKKVVFYLLGISIYFFYPVSFSQSASLPHNANFPASPSVAALAEYADTPVSYYSGTPNISIPLYTIETNGFNLPISLHYNASGIKVSQEASNVGLGWSLFSGGIITRQTRGGYDFKKDNPIGYFYNKENYNTPSNDMTEYKYEVAPSGPGDPDGFIVQRNIHKRDGEPDLFMYNFAGHSGKFILQTTAPRKGKGVLIEQNDNLTIDFSISGSDYTFIIKDDQGITYEFLVTEKSESLITSGISFPGSDSASFTPRTYDSWLLTRVILTNGEEINFTYNPFGNGSTKSIPITSQAKYIGVGINGNYCGGTTQLPKSNSYITNVNTIFSYIPNGIDWKDGRIEFKTAGRHDLPFADDKDQRIQEIKVFSKIGNKLIKHYKFGYNYFTNSNPSPQGIHMASRLKLISLSEFPIKNTENSSPKKYEFSYNETYELPLKNSNNYDHWGYYNRANNNRKDLLPEENDPERQHDLIDVFTRIDESSPNADFNLPNDLSIFFDGADRSPSIEAAKVGILTQIKYPTGGTENFEYELNTYINERNAGEGPSEFINNGGGVSFAFNPETNENVFNYEAPFTISGKVTNYKMRFGYTKETLDAIKHRAYTQANDFRIEIWKGSQMITSYLCAHVFDSDYVSTGSIGCDKSVLKVLPPGDYIVKLKMPNYLSNGTYQGVIVNGGISLKEQIPLDNPTDEPAQNLLGGGLRIKRISSQKNIREFNYNNSQNLSNGKLLGEYNYHSIQSFASRDCEGDQSGQITFLIRRSNSNYSLTGNLTGNIIGYSSVRERIINPSEPIRYTQNIYEFSNNISNERRWGVPRIERLSNGKLLKTHIFRNGLPVKTIENKYFILPFRADNFIRCANFNSDTNVTSEYIIPYAELNLGSTETTDKYLNYSTIRIIKTQETYNYNFHNGISHRNSIIKTDSKGDTYRTTIKYPLDNHNIPSNTICD